ncbi:atrial natriuretic peptide receptor 2-like [Liolophura sinensis]|uniref:atrial natriuretic peptide receptor 2-like n=1 Tax=Liolophura sinensis TaxID=3198878 RepID=UPI003157F86D
MDDNGDRDMDFVIKNIRRGQQVTVGYYNSSSDQVVFTDGVTIVWPGGDTKVPAGLPECGWKDEKCQANNTISIAIGVTFAAIFVAIFISASIAYLIKSRRQQQQMQSMTWRISSEELKMGARKPINFGSRISKSTIDSTGKSMVSMGTEGSDISFQNQLFTSVSMFRGSMVAIKPIHKLYVAVTDALIQEINAIRSLRHFNVNQLVGACIEPQKIVIVSHYCGRGSLSDVLENERIKLDWIFKIAFAADIAHGMAFIHDSPVECHGRLKSSNVFIDSHWTCKIGDFAMPNFREGEKPPNNGKHAEFYQLLWTAPELLRDRAICDKGTKKGDVYSFSIIMQEIVMRTGPYANSSADPQEIIERVKKAEHPWFRPTVPSTAAEESVLDLMRICWEEIPAFRPNFVTIRDTLKKLNNGHKINLVDQMVHMMEKYADHLEELVEERTTQLAEEQKKTEELLCRMLPKKITADLKLGKHVPPETFECVTIFFSDIVGFTALAHDSTPLEVVDFLNDLYTCFDTVIDTYDVYKVETIGDAYMVVSGLPVRNGIRHAGEIATMALDLLSSVVNFRIRHRPEKQLQLRIGVHSGPAVAGVVGLKMPRYCLFGDTVNYASRMESSGLALRIHVSPECQELLVQLGSFHLTARGDIAMKGKGVIQTYFLHGKEGFHKPLPDLAKAASLEEHHFK